MTNPETYGELASEIDRLEIRLQELKDRANPRTYGAQSKLLRRIQELKKKQETAPVVE